MGRSCRCSARFYREDSSPWAFLARVRQREQQKAPASVLLSARVRAFADAAVLVTAAVLLVGLFDGEQATAAEFLGDGAWSSAVASGPVHVVHSWLLLVDLDHEELQSAMASWDRSLMAG